MKLNKYPDNASYVDISKQDSWGDKVFKINSYEDIWHLKQFVDACNDIGDTPSIIIPNLLDAQADRRFDDGQSFGLKLVLQELANMKANFSIFHPHNPEVVEMAFEVIGSKVNIIDNTKFIEKVIDSLDWKNTVVQRPEGNIRKDHICTLMSADAGGFKPLMKLCDKLSWSGETYSASKSRKYEDGETILKQLIGKEDFGGKDILIVDDICVYGGTFKGLSKLLKEKNCGKLYLAASHITIQNHMGSDTVFGYFDKVFTTNSKFDEYFVEDSQGQPKMPSNLEVIKLF